MSGEQLLTVKEVADLLKRAPATIDYAIRWGALPAVEVNGEQRVPLREIQRVVMEGF